MTRTLTDWRRLLGAGCVALAAVGAPSLAQSPADGPPQEKQTEQVDSATKKLMAATGLYTRGLFKLAAGQYAEFLD